MQRRTFLRSVGLPLLAPTVALAAGAPLHAAPSAARPLVVRADTDRFGEDNRLGGVSPNHCKLSSVDTDGALAVFESLTIGKGGPSYHVHHGQDEWFFVREGAFVFRIGEDDHQLGPGDSAFVPRGTPHTWAHLGTGTGRMVFFVSPAGLMESYFREISRPEVQRTPEQARRLSEAHGMTRLGPGIAVR